MNAPTICEAPEGRCKDQEYRLAVYEAGHALTARALGLKILRVKILPRPPVLESDKSFRGNDWGSFVKTLENRVIELFGGLIAEEMICNTNSCCSGDVTRIDELVRLIAGLNGVEDPDDVWYHLDDVAQDIFADQAYRDAILPLSEFLYKSLLDGVEAVDGVELSAELDKHVPELPKKRSFLNPFGR